MTILGKSAQILAERGADTKAMSFVTTGIELLAKQLRDYADKKDQQQKVDEEQEKLLDEADKALDAIAKMLDIDRASKS